MKGKQLIELLTLVDGERDESFYRDLLAGYLIGLEGEEDLYIYAEPVTFDWHPDEGRLLTSEIYDELKKAVREIEDKEVLGVYLTDIDPLTLKEWWIEWQTSGIVYGKVMGKKKSYRFTPELPDLWVFVFEDDAVSVEKVNIPSFEVAIDMISINIEKSNDRVRRFWEYRGMIEIFFVGRTHDGKIIKKKIGEIGVDWKGQRQLVEDADEKINKIRKKIRELREKREQTRGKEKAKITRELKKLEKSLEFWLKVRNRHYKCALQIWGQVGDHKIKRIVVYKKRKGKKVIKKRKLVYNEIVNGYKVEKKSDFQKLKFGNQEIIIMKKDNVDFDLLKVKHRTVTEKKYVFFGKRGKLNHEIRVVGIPQRKVTVQVLVQAREEVFRKFVKVRKHPVEILEISGDEKIWVIKPVDGVSRLILHNKDHRKEGLDRILVHLDNQVMVFIHKL